MKTYTDSSQLPVREAIKGLPGYLPVEDTEEDDTQIRTQNADFDGQDMAWRGTDDEGEFLAQIIRKVALGNKLSPADAARQDGKNAASLGFEPRQSDSESLVLPLHHRLS